MSDQLPSESASAAPASGKGKRKRRGARLALYAPLAIFLLTAAFLGIGLTMNPRELPSPLIGSPAPVFSLPAVKGRELGLANTDLKGEVSLVNVFASWCAACREEHPLIMQLNSSGLVPIHGLNYKDKPDDALAWLNELGDPYTRTGADISGRVGIDWGVYGVPETFVIDRNGVIVYKHIGAITPKALDETIMPLVRKLQQ